MVSYTDPTDGTPVQDTQPSPSDGAQWVDTSQSPPELKIYDSATQAWLPADTNETVVSQSQPTPEVGKLWFEPISDGTNLYAATSAKWEFLKFLSEYPNSAIHRWAHDEGSGSTLGDSIGSNDGSISGATYVSVSDAQGGFVLDYDGSNDQTSASAVPEASAGDSFSIGVTVNADSTSSDQTIIENRVGSSDRFAFGIDGGNSEIIAETYDGSFTGTGIGSADTDTNRHRYLITVDAGTIKIYQDTSDVSSTSTTNSALTSGSNALFFGDRGGTGVPYDGRLDDIIIYDSVLSSSEIQSDFDIQPWT